MNKKFCKKESKFFKTLYSGISGSFINYEFMLSEYDFIFNKYKFRLDNSDGSRGQNKEILLEEENGSK